MKLPDFRWSLPKTVPENTLAKVLENDALNPGYWAPVNKQKPAKFISGLEGVTAGLQIFAGVVQIHGWMPYPSIQFYVCSKRNMRSGILESNPDGQFL